MKKTIANATAIVVLALVASVSIAGFFVVWYILADWYAWPHFVAALVGLFFTSAIVWAATFVPTKMDNKLLKWAYGEDEGE